MQYWPAARLLLEMMLVQLLLVDKFELPIESHEPIEPAEKRYVDNAEALEIAALATKGPPPQ